VLVDAPLLRDLPESTAADLAADADLCLHPPIDKFSLMDFPKLDQIVEAGYDYTREVLEKWDGTKALRSSASTVS
jgi:predicted acylesterase/phospholipase RssA